MMQPFRIPAHTYIPDNHSGPVEYMGRASRAVTTGDVGLSDFPDENPM